MTIPAPRVHTPWYDALPEAYRDRVQWDPWSGRPSCIDVDAGPYLVPRVLTNADRAACHLPPLLARG